jgi:hypothetical protein
VAGSEIAVDEIWNRIKPGDDQRANVAKPGRALLGTWESIARPGAPKAMRTIKQIMPSHWSWAAYDRENRMVPAAAGGRWSLKDGEYVEQCDFTTENFPQARGKSFPYAFQVDGDRWILKGGRGRGVRDDDIWTRVK